MTASRSWTLVVVGYAVLALAMIAFLTINGVSDTAVGTAGTAGLIGIGLLLPAAGMLELARRMDPSQGSGRKGLVLQSLSLMGLLVGLLVSFLASSLPGHLVSAAFIVLAGISGLAGAIFISKEARARQMIIGTALIALGAALIPASNIASQMGWVLDLDKNVYQDVGATFAACGCVVVAYSCFVLRSHAATPVVRSRSIPAD